MSDNPFRDFEYAIETVTEAVRIMKARNEVLASDKRSLEARLQDAEVKASTYETRANEFEEKARRLDDLEQASQKLVEALNRLPLKMEDAGIILSAITPDIPLYSTYEWQAVMNAKHALEATKGAPQ